MKTKTLLLLFFITISHLLISQESDSLRGNFEFTQTILPNISNQVKYEASKDSANKGVLITKSEKQIPLSRGYKVSVIKTDSNLVYYRYWKFNGNDSLNTELRGKYNDNGAVFTMPIKDFKQITRPLYPRYKGATAGAYTVPFRLRGLFDDFDFESSLSLSANLVVGLGTRHKQESCIDLSIGFGLTNVNLNEKNTKGTVTENRSVSAFTLSFGILAKPSNKVNIGVFGGSDFLGLNDRDVNWIYDGKFWLGLGININFNSIDNPENSTKPKNQ